MVKIRLQRVGTKKRPFYRVVVMDELKRRDGGVVENLGQYQPIIKDGVFNVKEDRVIDCLKRCAADCDGA